MLTQTGAVIQRISILVNPRGFPRVLTIVGKKYWNV